MDRADSPGNFKFHLPGPDNKNRENWTVKNGYMGSTEAARPLTLGRSTMAVSQPISTLAPCPYPPVSSLLSSVADVRSRDKVL